MIKNISYGLILLCIVSQSVSAQNISNLFMSNEERGDQMVEDLYFDKAVIYYELAHKKEPGASLKIKIANTYRTLSDYTKAVEWYDKAYQEDPQTGNSLDKFYYAESLLSAGQIDKAREWYELYGQQEARDSRTAKKIRGIDLRHLMERDSSTMEIKLLPFNSEYSDFGASAYNNGIVYSSARGTNTFIDPDYLREEDLMDLYYTGSDSAGNWSSPQIFDRNLTTHYHEGPIAFFNDGENLILTQSNQIDKKRVQSTDGKTKPQLYLAKKNNGEWIVESRLPINNQSYSLAHPALNSTNDTLYFSSDIPGGYGGNDIFRSVLINGEWSDLTNMGSIINTEGDDMHPFYAQNRLFFSSNGHQGFGGLDIYKAVLDGAEIRGIKNMGYPINSNNDDFSFSLDPMTMTGYFSSNRPGGKGSDDIYSVALTSHVVSGIAIQTQTREPIGDVNIKLITNGQASAETATDEEGNFHFYVPFSSDFEIEASKEGHSYDTKVTFTSQGNPIDIDTVLVELRFQDLFARGIVYDNQTQEGIEGAEVILENLSDNLVDTLITGSDGMYSFPISPKKEFVVRASKYHFIPDSLKFTSFGIEKGELLNDFILDEEYVDKEVIYFNYNISSLRRDAYPTLNKILKILKQYPKDFLIIGAHADARGTKEYNQELSDARAQNTLKYFTDRGIKPSQIIARGFGEAFIINRCADGANCLEEDHSQNRRTELTVEKELPDEELKD